MVEVIIGDLFSSKAQTLVNTVNCVGVMGKGVALEFKKRFPAMYKDYVARCERRQVKLGEPYLFRHVTPPWVLNFPTKDHWRSVAKLDDIVRGLRYLIDHYEAWGITSLAVPPLGCGQGQLEWRIVGPTLYRHLSEITVPVELYAPYGTPHEELLPGFLERSGELTVTYSSMPEPSWVPAEWVVIAEVVKRIEDEPYHYPIGRTTFQKIAFVVTEEGVPTELEFVRDSFGPFSPGLKPLESRLVNNGLLRVEQFGRMHRFSVGETYDAAMRAYQDAIQRWEPTIDRVVDLFLRLDTAAAEVTTTALFAARQLTDRVGKPTERMVFDEVMEWKKRRKPPLDPEVVAETIRGLSERDWLDVRTSDDLPVSEPDLQYA